MPVYILRRILLMIPTLIGIMLINFALTLAVPGGPIETLSARLEGEGEAADKLMGGGSETKDSDQEKDSTYLGARGLPPEFLDQIEIEFGFARIVCDPAFTGTPSLKDPACRKEKIGEVERFFIMMGKYLTFDFGESYFKSESVMALIVDKLPVSITLGLWSTLLAYLISIPLGIRKAVKNGSSFDVWTSGIIIGAYSIPSLLFALLLMVLFAGGSFFRIFPLRGLTSDGFADMTLIEQIKDYLWHIVLPVTAQLITAFTTLTLLTKNSFLDEIGKQYVMTARAKGLSESRVLYGHVFRNAMMIVIAGFPSAFIGVFFGSSLFIEKIFTLDGLGLLGYNAIVGRDYPIIFATLYVSTLMGMAITLISDLTYMLIDPRIDFEARR
ncbi:microcin C ABC transporter permease YejB [Stagnihabitans tardus]|uniref:ABC transporter permease subunit n=1 Tax=Stagnihabitans tardus TaxID=2699202 RepID=A0AAE5BTI5_9RHOB|nr:ABC transporter permease subunit [Stagnihabitans tardus]NBZ86751.1 ABC transporter permease subunit [Stagnihabitans tardus]